MATTVWGMMVIMDEDQERRTGFIFDWERGGQQWLLWYGNKDGDIGDDDGRRQGRTGRMMTMGDDKLEWEE